MKRANLIITTKTNLHNNSNHLDSFLKTINAEKLDSNLKIKKKLIGQNKRKINQSKIISKNIYLISAIGDNTGFKKAVEKINCNIVGHSKFIDHFNYKISDLKIVQKKAKKARANYLITTEKDLVKMGKMIFEIPIYALRIEMFFKPENKLKNKLNNLFN